jgi:hypothetical protein
MKEESQHSRGRARARERRRNKLKQQIECGIIWIQQCPTRNNIFEIF